MFESTFLNYSQEQFLMILITAISNFAALPAMYLIYRRRLVFPFFAAWFTTLTSFMYHLCDSVNHPIGLTEGEWHRLDNVGSIFAFNCLFVYLMDNNDRRVDDTVMSTSLGIILIIQECDPWNVWFTVIPIVVSATLPLLKFVFSWKIPNYQWSYFSKGGSIMIFAFIFFFRGLDDDNDYLRWNHGMWHALVGSASYFMWQSCADPEREGDKHLFVKTTLPHRD